MSWLDDLDAAARETLPDYVYAYYAMTAGDGITHREGLRDWAAPRLRPRVLTGGHTPDTTTTVLGTPLATPILVAPTAQAAAAHPDGEAAVGAAAAQVGSLVGVSTHTAIRFDRITAAGAPWWFQVYVMKDRGITAALAQSARDRGATALILTVDLPSLKTRASQHEPSSWTDAVRAARGINADDLRERGRGDRSTAGDLGPETIGWLREVSGLPVIVKGVLRADDATMAVGAGAAGVLVSTHGGRALDRSITSTAALPAVVSALADTDAEVYVDSGIRSGTDVLVALALGARAVFVGRPALWGLATGGADGVRSVLDQLTAELRMTMSFTGAHRIGDISREMLA